MSRMAALRTRRRAHAIACVVAAVACLSGCAAAVPASRPSPSSGSPAAPSPSAPSPSLPSSSPESVPGWPSGIAALGHSGLTGSGILNTGVDERQDSWATGDNPDIDSVYRRILDRNPAIEGHAINLAVDGSGIDGLLRQATALTRASANPGLIVIQSIDNDMRCDGTDDQHVLEYRQGLVDVMDVLTTAFPEATVFFVSRWATAQQYATAVSARDPSHIAGTGLCDLVDSATMAIDPDAVATVQRITEQYFAAIVDVCSAYPNCRTDGGAMQRLQLDPEDLTVDMNHLMPSGQAKMAQIAWTVLFPGE